MKQTVVLYPSTGIGHVVPMSELAKIFLSHGYDVTVVTTPPPFESDALGSSHVERIAAANPAISFHVLPPIPPPDFAGSGKHPFLLMLQMLQQYNGELESFLCSIPRESLHSLVVDLFCIDAGDVAKRLGIPAYAFVPSNASCLAILTQLPSLVASTRTALKELGDTPLEFLGVPPMPASHLIKELLLNPEDEMCRTMANMFKRGTTGTRGILVNTFEALESRALQALRDPLCVPGQVLPPIYCVGPLIARDSGSSGEEAGIQQREHEHECLAWLDTQPERSVVFLCFGSMGVFSEEQLREIAIGLDKSGQRFLWVVRAPANIDDPKMLLEQRREPEVDALLPEGFLERTRGRGLVVKSWAPQVKVLRHPATGAFVTHCGWNSTLEGIVAGVPMLCWPLYAEQKMNKVVMTQEMGVGVELEGYMTGFIKAQEVEAKVRLVMESTSEEVRELKVSVEARKKQAAVALEAGGSSRAAFVQFLTDVENIGPQLAE